MIWPENNIPLAVKGSPGMSLVKQGECQNWSITAKER